MKKCFSQVNRILVATNFMKKKLLKFGLEEKKISKLTFGIESDNSVAPSREKGNGKKLTIGFIGTLYFHKGADVLLKAIRLTPEDLPVSVKLYGSLEQFPSYSHMLQTIVGNDQRIEFRGTFPNERIGKILKQIDILVVPSLWHENSPLIIHSAQEAHIPVVCSNTEGVSEIIQNDFNGLLFERGNVEALSEIIQRLCHNREIVKRLSRNAKKPKSIVTYVNELEQVYDSLVNHDVRVTNVFQQNQNGE